MYVQCIHTVASTGSGKQTAPKAVVKKLEPPVGDDFFATFGV